MEPNTLLSHKVKRILIRVILLDGLTPTMPQVLPRLCSLFISEDNTPHLPKSFNFV